MAVSGWLGRNNLTRLRVDLQLPEEIYDGLETLVTVRLHNLQRRLPVCLLQFDFEGGQARCSLVPRGGRARLPLPVTFRGRGVRKLQTIRVTSTFPINFFVRSLALPLSGEVLVFPRPRPTGLPASNGAGASQGDLAKDKGYEGDLTRIADYRGGEPLKMIHWKISARQDQLKVKELSSLAAPPLLVEPLRLPGGNLEERLGAACWLIKDLCRKDRSIGLQLGDLLIPPARGRQHQLRLLGALARHGNDGTDTHAA